MLSKVLFLFKYSNNLSSKTHSEKILIEENIPVPFIGIFSGSKWATYKIMNSFRSWGNPALIVRFKIYSFYPIIVPCVGLIFINYYINLEC